jgi:flagella basal body P-ring formation protein FlgA
MNRALALAALLTLLAGPAAAADVDLALITEAIRVEARRNLPDTVVEVEVYDVSVRGDLEVPDGAGLRVRGGGEEDWIGRVSVDLICAGRTVKATAEVAALVEVPVLRRPVARGEPLAAEDVGVARRDVSDLPSGLIMSVAAVVGRVPKKDLGLNRVVKEGDLEDRADAERNQPVTLLLRSGGLRVTAPGVLRKDARVGDLVEAVFTSTGRVVRGILIAPDIVEIPTADASAIPTASR